MKDKPVSVDDYKEVADDFFAKYDFVAQRIEGRAEDVLKVMEALTGAVMRDRAATKIGPFGFNKQNGEDTKEDDSSNDSGS
tara:strand:- start:2148 stop:2390 length:243 start_codon:yes stop_codon:yes gene_type:complete